MGTLATTRASNEDINSTAKSILSILDRRVRPRDLLQLFIFGNASHFAPPSSTHQIMRAVQLTAALCCAANPPRFAWLVARTQLPLLHALSHDCAAPTSCHALSAVLDCWNLESVKIQNSAPVVNPKPAATHGVWWLDTRIVCRTRHLCGSSRAAVGTIRDC